MKIIYLLLLLFPFSVFAESMIGYGISTGTYRAEDSEGPTANADEQSIARFFYANKLHRDSMWYAEYYQLSLELPANDTNIGQNVDIKAINIGYLKRYAISRNIKPWLGAGFNLSSNQYKDRHTADSDGYLLKSYKDLEEENISAFAEITFSFDLSDDALLNARIQHIEPLSHGVLSNTFTLMFLYKI